MVKAETNHLSDDPCADLAYHIADEPTSTTSEATSLRAGDTGHVHLLRTGAATANGRSIPHCRVSNPPHFFILALIVSVICLPLGLIAVVFSLLSKRFHKHGEYMSAKHYGNVSKWLSLVGLAVSAVIAAFVIVYFVEIDKNIVDTPEEFHDDLKGNF